ncbi:acetate--CoA ligase family protein [Nonomuraea basaltis]|uniref:acetate--CoA ligase family protein n=1 Tax=Nonomuraea basaltis TaxID=2495887 RepID=UPI00110C5CCA|nr:acetate--CoA ligase family protein [Nonomuraea basaltis]TMR97782.1 carboxylate--amine ligase [Nonomuraea basaltis]
MTLRPLSEWESKRLLGPALPTAREARTTSAAQARAFARDIGAPVVAKASGVAHKSDAGLVRLGLGPEDAAACWAELAAAGDGTVLVAEQLRGELELIVGGSRDPSFGALVTVGLGGVATEVFDDVAVLLAPPEAGELDRALGRLRGARLLNGHRGAPPVDRAGLALIVDLVAALLEADPDVVEIDCNPVLVHDGRPTVLDALVVKR